MVAEPLAILLGAGEVAWLVGFDAAEYSWVDGGLSKAEFGYVCYID